MAAEADANFDHQRLLVGAILVLLLVRAFVAANIGLSDDEAYYRLWALAPALSYLDHPPMVGWLIALGRGITGDTEFGVRLPALIAFMIGSIAIWRACHLLFGAEVAATAVLLTLAMPLLGAGGIIITPDGPSVLFWGLAFWALAELQHSRRPHWWLAVGLFAGLGLISKYTNLFLGAGIVIWLLAVPGERRWLASWQLWAGGVVALLCTVPVVYWNAVNGWVSFSKQFGRAARGHELTAAYVLEMVGGFVGLASPIIAGLAAIGFYQLVRRALARRASADVLLVSMILPSLAYFLVHALHARVQANWLAPLYPMLAICAAVVLHGFVPSTRRLLAGPAAGLGLLMTGLLYLHALQPIDGGLARKDPTDQLRGWQDFGHDVDAMRVAHGAQWVATSSYATTAQLAFALKTTAPVFQLNDRIRYRHLPSPPLSLSAAPAIYVELERRQAPELLARKYRSVQRLGTLVRRDHGETLASYATYLVADPIGDVFSPPG